MNIWTNDPYIYKATNSGVNVYNIATEALISIAYWNEGISSVWANNDYLYMATSNSGILWLSVSSISGSSDVTDQMSVYKAYPDITDNYVNYLHGSGDYLCVTTISGVDHIDMVTDDRIYTTVSDVTKCYQTESGRFYYILSKAACDWEYMKPITLIPVTTISGQRVEIELTPSDFNYSKADEDGEDIRFKDSSFNSLDYWIEEWNYEGNSIIWVKVPNIGTDKIYLFYGNSVATNEGDVDAIFDFYDDCSGVFDVKWQDHSGYYANCYYNNEKLYISKSVTWHEGANALTKKTSACTGRCVIEFKWIPCPKVWRIDNLNGGEWSAKNIVELVQINPSYITTPTPHYDQCEWGVGVNSKLMLHLRSPLSDKITIQERVNGSESLVLDETFYYESEHQIKWIIDFDSHWTELYMDGYQIGERETWNPTLLSYIGDEFKLNFHWHNALSATYIQIYDDIKVKKYSPELTMVFGDEELVRNFKDKLITVYDNTQNWTEPGYSYEVGDGIILTSAVSDTYITDVYITEGTSKYQSSDNVIFLVTNDGAAVIEERKDDEENSRFKYFYLE